MLYACVAAGGALGSVARFWLGSLVTQLLGDAFPWGTVLVNVVGSLAIGWFGGLTAAPGRFASSEVLRVFVMAGICGGFTTFSAFSLQTMELLRAGETMRAAFNAMLSLVVCVAAAGLGMTLAKP